jgi:adenylate kinase
MTFTLSIFRTWRLIFYQTRNYPEIKLQENLDTEIMEVLLQEARDAFDEEIVIELQSTTSEEMDTNVDRIEAWVTQWKKDNAEP